MSDTKKLLNESTIRRFMTLASIGGLSDGFVDKYKKPISEMGSVYARDEEGFGAPEEELPPLGGEEMPPPEEELPPGEGLEGEPEISPDEPASEATVAELVDAIAAAITDSTGIEVSTEETAEELPPDEEMPGDEEELEPGLEPEAGLEGGEEMPPPGEDPLAEAAKTAVSKEEDALLEKMVSRITQRVAARLLKEKK